MTSPYSCSRFLCHAAICFRQLSRCFNCFGFMSAGQMRDACTSFALSAAEMSRLRSSSFLACSATSK